MCLARGITTPATIANHIESHGGDWNAFRLGALQSLCKPCHDRGKRLLDLDGCSQDIDEDGWPIDGRHRANASRTPRGRRARWALLGQNGQSRRSSLQWRIKKGAKGSDYYVGLKMLPDAYAGPDGRRPII